MAATPKIKNAISTLLNLSSADTQRRQAVIALIEWNGNARDRKALLAGLTATEETPKRRAASAGRS